MSFLYQIERKQAALIASRKGGEVIHTAKPAEPELVTTATAVTIGVQLDLELNAQVDSLILRGVAPSKTAAILTALREYLTQHEYDETVAHAVRVPTAEGRRVTIGVELEAPLNARLTAFCKRFTCYKRRAVIAAVMQYVEKNRAVRR
jgi:metal-responsive CopG/Arc/MetJ family transcriptional regulator